MKHPLTFLFLVFSLLGASYLLAQNNESSGKKIWKYIAYSSPYRSWQTWDSDIFTSTMPAVHGIKHRVYINDVGANSTRLPVTYGTVIVKENLDDESRLTSLTVMSKIEGFNPEGGDWFWAKYLPDGKIERAGKVSGCIGCHKSVAADDYLFVKLFKPQKNGK